MLVFVDFEHADGHVGEHGERLLAARTRITYRLEDLADRPCHLVRYNRVDHALLDAVEAEAIFISGNSTPPDQYATADVDPIMAILRTTTLPVFGLCGGFQLLARALGVQLEELGPHPDNEEDRSMFTLDDGRIFEFGYHPICVADGAKDHPLLAHLGDAPVFRHAHSLHVPTVPSGFEVLGSTRSTPVQMAVNAERRMVGTQFHPEYWTDEHPEGRQLLANFLRWSGVVP